MDGAEAMEQLFQGPHEDVSGSYQCLARGGTEGGGGGGNSGGEGNRGNQRTSVGIHIGGGVDEDQEVADKMGEGGGPGEGSFQGGADGRRIHVAGGGTDPQGDNGLPRYRPRGVGMKGSGGDS